MNHRPPSSPKPSPRPVRLGVRLEADPPLEPWLLATLNRFHFRRLWLGPGLDSARILRVDTRHPQGVARLQGQGRGRALSADYFSALRRCYTPYVQARGKIANRRSPGPQARDPWADRLADRLEAELCRAWGVDGSPPPRPFALMFTYDVDVVGPHALGDLKSGLVCLANSLRVLRDREAFRFYLGAAATFLRLGNPHFGFGEIAEQAHRRHYRPLVFLFARLPDYNGLSPWQRLQGLNPNYSLGDPLLRRALRILREVEAEIGLHGSYLSPARPDMLAREKRALARASGRTCRVIRQHFLNFHGRACLESYRELGLEMESSCGYVYDNGLLCRTTRPFYSVAPRRGGQGGVVTVPMVFMDAVPLYFRPRSPRRVWQDLEDLLGLMTSTGGLAAVNFHQRMLSTLPAYGEIHRRLLEEVTRRRGICASWEDLELLFPSRPEVRA